MPSVISFALKMARNLQKLFSLFLAMPLLAQCVKIFTIDGVVLERRTHLKRDTPKRGIILRKEEAELA